jgi:hypothetical protein
MPEVVARRPVRRSRIDRMTGIRTKYFCSEQITATGVVSSRADYSGDEYFFVL